MEAACSSSSITSVKGPATCEICSQSPSKYMCPRCGIPYCSLACYKNEAKHLQCSESFYKDCVMENIRSEEKQNPEMAKKMNEILQRAHKQYNEEDEFEEDEEIDSDDDEPLEKRLQGVDLNNAEEVWKRLTVDERREFETITKNVDLASDIIPEWVPWWREEPDRKLVVDISEESESTSSLPKIHKRQPDWLHPIPKMSDLTKVKPNQHVGKGLVNVVTAYVWTGRLFNGDLFDPEKVVEVASCMIYLSSFLKRDGVFKNIEHAVADVPLNACQVPVLSEGGDTIQTGLNCDIWIIIKGPDKVKSHSPTTYLLSALTDCYRVFEKASKALKRSNDVVTVEHDETSESFLKNFPNPPPLLPNDFKITNKAKRKLLYLIAFANEFMEQIKFD